MTTNKRERFSKQIGRILVILEILSDNGPSTVGQVTTELENILRLGYCKRTVRRDLDTLVECGFVSYESAGQIMTAGVYKLAGNCFMINKKEVCCA